MRTWKEAFRDGLVSGTAASAASATALTVCGRLEGSGPAAPTNAISHWLWGERAMLVNRATARHTLAGYAIHHGASIFWATLYEKFLAGGRKARPAAEVAAAAGAAAGIACFVDYRLTPRRLRPGFEKRLSRASLLAVYGAFAAGLAAATLVRQRR